ncbi:MAG: hypothetical protein ABSD27_12480 [Bryobacteraceae bacterium]
MVRQLLALALLSSAVIGPSSIHATLRADQGQSSQDHVAWVAEALERMQTIKPGMTREDLLNVFTTEGGLSTGLQRTFVSRDCPYFKVDVEFEAVGRPNRDNDGRVTLIEGSQDIIVKISRPYLQFSHMD